MGVCYSYDILKSVCFKIGYLLNYKTAEGQWQFRDGCYENGQYLKYERATPSKIYDFKNVDIEIRADYKISRTGMPEGHIDLSYFKWLSNITIYLSAIGILVYIISRIAILKYLN